MRLLDMFPSQVVRVARLAAAPALLALAGVVAVGCGHVAQGHVATAVPAAAALAPPSARRASSPDAETSTLSRSDLDVGQAVEDRLATDHVVPLHSVRVDVNQGIVRLSGFVDDLLAYQRAPREAENVPGVRGVVNDIVVRRSSDDDAATWLGVNQALATNPATAPYAFDVSVSAGKVTLQGNVDSWAERQLARQIASRVDGVVAVDNRVFVRFDASRPDTEIRNDVRQRLAEDVGLRSDHIGVAVKGGRVTLRGFVGSDRERDLAIHDTKVKGVRAVNAEALQAPWWRARLEGRQPVAAATPAVLRRTIRDEFAADAFVAAPRPQVAVSDGVAMLSGQVANPRERRAVVRDAFDTVGIHAVRYDLHLAPVPLPFGNPSEEGTGASRVPVA